MAASRATASASSGGLQIVDSLGHKFRCLLSHAHGWDGIVGSFAVCCADIVVGEGELDQPAWGVWMGVAAVTPRVRTIVICDVVSASRTEERVFALKGVRQHLEAASFPWRATQRLFLLLSNPRKGKYAGKVLIVNERNDRLIRYVKFFAALSGRQRVVAAVC